MGNPTRDSSVMTEDENNHLMIVSEEAKIVKRICWEHPEGSNILKIVHGLEASGTLNGAGNEKWHTSNVNQIPRSYNVESPGLLCITQTNRYSIYSSILLKTTVCSFMDIFPT